MMTTSADIKAALRRHYDKGYRVFFEVSNDTGANARRWVDAVAIGIWPSTGHEIIGIEIKVSRGDFLRELAQPEKAQALMRYCTRWCLACPAGLVTADEVPASWGVLELTAKDTIKRRKPPPLLKPETLDVGFIMALLRQERDPDMELVHKLVAEHDAVRNAGFERSVEREAASRVRDNTKRHDRALAVADKMGSITGVDFAAWDFDPAALAAAYLLLKRTDLHLNREHWSAFGNLDHHLAKARETLTAIEADPVFSALREAVKGAA